MRQSVLRPDEPEHSILISIAQILISIERSARYELVLVPVDGHTVLGYRTSAAVAGGRRAAWAAGDKVDGRLSAVAGGARTRVKNGTSPVSHLVVYRYQLRSTVCPVFDHLEGDAMAWRWSDNDAALARRVRQAHLARR